MNIRQKSNVRDYNFKISTSICKHLSYWGANKWQVLKTTKLFLFITSNLDYNERCWRFHIDWK